MNEEDLQRIDAQRSKKVKQNQFLQDLVEEVKRLPQHFVWKQTSTSDDKAVLRVNLHGTVLVTWDQTTDVESVEIIPAEITAGRKKTVFANVFGFVCADINERGVVLASAGRVQKDIDFYDVSEDEELDGEFERQKEKKMQAEFGNYSELLREERVREGNLSENGSEDEDKQTRSGGIQNRSKLSPSKQVIRESKISSLKIQLPFRPDFFDPKLKHRAKVHFRCFEPGSSFSRTLPSDEQIVDVSISDRLVNVLTQKYIRSYSFSGHLMGLISLNSCPLALVSIQGHLGLVYRHGLPVQGAQNLKLNIYEVSQSKLVLKTDICISADSELEYIGFDKRGCVFVKDSRQAVKVLVGQDVWLPVFETVKGHESERVDLQRRRKFEQSKFVYYFL